MKPIHEMLFTEFVDSIRPTGGVNRFPPMGQGADVLSYSVYMNGPLANLMPEDSREQHYKDVLLHPLTEKLGLDPTSYRDNMKVAELVSVRDAWMSSVIEATMWRGDKPPAMLSEEVTHDYELLSHGLTHPWLLEQVATQRILSQKLAPAMVIAATQVNASLTERAPDVVNKGQVVSQTPEYTVQLVDADNHVVVAHDNKKLGGIPPIGADIVISYYRGKGQVFPNTHDLNFSGPFVEPKSGSLGMLVSSKDNTQEQVVLFNSAMEFEKFVGAQGLSYGLVKEAVELKVAAQSKSVGTVALGSNQPNVVERLAAEVLNAGKQFGIQMDNVKIAQLLEGGRTPDGMYIGKVVGVDDRLGLVYQSLGQGKGTVHRLDTLSKMPVIGEVAEITVKNGRGVIADKGVERNGVGR